MQVNTCLTGVVEPTRTQRDSGDQQARRERTRTPSEDSVFKALADGTRRRLLDSLHAENGQTLRALCGQTGMTRQSATQHLDILEAANLISTVKSGREKLHYLNPVPLHEIQARWIGKFERPRLRALSTVKKQAEEAAEIMTDKPSFVYVTYIEGTPERVWQALTDAEMTAAYWGHSNVSDWQEGSGWEHRRTDGSDTADVTGTVVESLAPFRLVTTWAAPDGERSVAPELVTFEIEQFGAIVRLTVTHTEIASEAGRRDAAAGWPAVLSNLKSFIETGRPLPQAPWEMPWK
jgi:uncharacterized protein YndB with AHSA1/START domain/DNA-binding transcriptional ArsR family regulator